MDSSLPKVPHRSPGLVKFKVLLVWIGLSLVGGYAWGQSHWQQTDYLKQSFYRIVYGNEYQGQAAQGLRKWTGPIRYTYQWDIPQNASIKSMIEAHWQQLAQISGLQIEQAAFQDRLQNEKNKDRPNVFIRLTNKRLFRQRLEEILGRNAQSAYIYEDALCFAHFSTLGRGQIVQAQVIIPVDAASEKGKLPACISEEITQILGLPNDSDLVYPSTFNDKSPNELLTGLDYVLIKMLYHPDVEVGASWDQLQPQLPAVLADLKRQRQILRADYWVQQGGLAAWLRAFSAKK